jgi:hypothetical protein
MTTTTAPLTTGTAYVVTYRPTLYGKPVTTTATLTEILTTGTGRRTLIFHGKRGRKLVLAPTELIAAVPA